MSEIPPNDPRRSLPAVHDVLALPLVSALVQLYGRDAVMVQVRYAIDSIRAGLSAETESALLEREIAAIPDRVAAALGDELGRPLRRVINATGILLHTNLGRAPLPLDVAEALPKLLSASCDLEIDLETGRRSDRNRAVEGWLCALTGAEAALVVNNNAAAIVLLLTAHAQGRDVVLSRGELVEIGGSFRIHEMIEATGARLVEVGTTNRTRWSDFESALSAQTALLMKVYPSNYRVAGFVEQPGVAALVELASRYSVPLVVDEGSGMLRPRSEAVFTDHLSMAELVAAGADLVCGSGDKLLGGPQAGLLVGKKRWIDPCRKHPFYRAFRPDRSTFASLNAVLQRHAIGAPFPIDRLWVDRETHRGRLEPLAARLGAQIVSVDAFVGGGTAPEAPIPGLALALPADDELLMELRQGSPSVVGYQRRGQLILDLRTVDPSDDTDLLEAVDQARRGSKARAVEGRET